MDSVLRDRFSLLAAVGCGVALGVSGIYSYYRTNRQFCDQINTLTNTIEDLKREVYELRITSQSASRAVSHIHTPIASHTHFLNNSIAGDYFVQSSNQYDGHEALDSSFNNRLDYSTDDNEEFYDFTEGDQESESIESMNELNQNDKQKVMDNNSITEVSFEQWLQDCDILLEDLSTDKQQLYDQIKWAQNRYGSSADILWRLTKATHLLSIAAQKRGNADLKKQLTFETLEHAKQALEKDNMNAECHKWYAVAIGSISDFVTVKERIENGGEFKKHVDMALKLKPHDPTLYHMLGRWCYEVSNLTWVERKVASALFSKVPESSFEEALKTLLKAYQLKNEWKENILYIAKILINQKKYKDAIDWIDKGIHIKSKGEDDLIAHEELKTLQSKYAKYR